MTSQMLSRRRDSDKLKALLLKKMVLVSTLLRPFTINMFIIRQRTGLEFEEESNSAKPVLKVVERLENT